jgi:hypothetical protein
MYEQGTIRASRYMNISDSDSIEDCRWRVVRTHDGVETAHCHFLQQVFGAGHDEVCVVNRDVCEACCKTFPPTFETLNPVIASLVFDRAEGLAGGETQRNEIDRRHSLRRWAEQHLEIEIPALPQSTGAPARPLRQRFQALIDLLPPPQHRCGETVKHWAVGVTTAPRRQSHLDECLDSLAQAGWSRPHLFIDGAISRSDKYSTLPATSRDEQIGAWPNYYLSLLELLMREPLADAFLMVQDDALFYCRENIRNYLEELLWPGDTPGIVSLYCAAPDTQKESGWFRYQGPWKYSSIAFIFPREVAQRLVIAPPVFHHRWAGDDEGRVGIPDVVASWAEANSTPIYFPSPSLTQHIGETSAIWLGAYDLQPNRRAGLFLDDQLLAANPRRLRPNDPVADFPEIAFPCARANEANYRMHVARGRERMAAASAVICGLCRDVAPQLPATIARIERLAGMFQSCSFVFFENDSVDDTPELLRRWAFDVPNVYIISERLDQPRLHGACRLRTERMAYYRNRCRDVVLTDFSTCDFVVVADMDLEGWSYDGVANTFGQDGWDFVGSNGLSFDALDALHSFEYVDAFAYRTIGQLSASGEAHYLHFERGEPLVPVWSCFGGLGVYRTECYKAANYDGEDCEHVTFHRALREKGFERLFLNPSQFVLYSPWSIYS